MATDVQIHRGTCPIHGAVEATREVPGQGFAFVRWARRLTARRRPFRCPTCGTPVTPL